jgi:2'-5' RNA ligase
MRVPGGSADRSGLTRHHVTAFLTGTATTEVERLRRKWDPEMARQIAAHVTLVYPEEVADPAELAALAASVAADLAPFRLRFGAAIHTGSPADGVFLRVDDVDGGIAAFRAAVARRKRAIDFPPHITIVHPRTSALGAEAWAEVAKVRIDAQCTVSWVAVTAFDGRRWRTARLIPLGAAG